MKRFRYVTLLCVSALLAMAAEAGGTALARHETKAKPKTLRVSIVVDRQNVGRYNPKTLTVHLGDHVVFRNSGNAPHTVSADNNSFDSGTIEIGKSWTYTAKKAGVFTYFCQFHGGMHGKIIVKR